MNFSELTIKEMRDRVRRGELKAKALVARISLLNQSEAEQPKVQFFYHYL